MDKNLKVILVILFTTGLSFVLAIADSGTDLSQLSQFYTPMIFAGTLSLSFFFPSIRKYLLILSFGLLLIMLVFYFIGQINMANWFGSLGFGLLMMLVISYLPQLLKQGYIDKY